MVSDINPINLSQYYSDNGADHVLTDRVDVDLQANLDEFDPYAETETTEVVETRVDAEGVVHTTVTKTTRVIRSRSNSREVPDTQTDEPPCDDLLGGLANGTMTTTSGMVSLSSHSVQLFLLHFVHPDVCVPVWHLLHPIVCLAINRAVANMSIAGRDGILGIWSSNLQTLTGEFGRKPDHKCQEIADFKVFVLFKNHTERLHAGRLLDSQVTFCTEALFENLDPPIINSLLNLSVSANQCNLIAQHLHLFYCITKNTF